MSNGCPVCIQICQPGSDRDKHLTIWQSANWRLYAIVMVHRRCYTFYIAICWSVNSEVSICLAEAGGSSEFVPRKLQQSFSSEAAMSIGRHRRFVSEGPRQMSALEGPHRFTEDPVCLLSKESTSEEADYKKKLERRKHCTSMWSMTTHWTYTQLIRANRSQNIQRKETF